MGPMTEFMGQFREQGKLPSSTVVNPKGGFETAKAITLRSGNEVGTNPQTSKSSQKEDEKLLLEEEEDDKATTRVEQSLPQPPKDPTPPNSSKVVPNSILSNLIPPNVPIPCRSLQSKEEESEKDILEAFPKVQVDIPILELIKEDVLETTISKEVEFYDTGQVTTLKAPNLAECNSPKSLSEFP